MAKWEYHTLTINGSLIKNNGYREEMFQERDFLQTQLDKLGEEGWELVIALPQVESNTNHEFQLEGVSLKYNHLVFKREI